MESMGDNRGWMMGLGNAMMDLPGHMLAGVVVLFVLAVALAVIIVRLMQHPAERPRYPLLSDQPVAEEPSSPVAPEPLHSTHAGDAEQIERYVFVIPDISGYTELVRPSRFSISHAHRIVRALITALMEAFAPPFEAARIEGDAVLFHATAEKMAYDPKAFSDVVMRGFKSFDSRLQELINRNACPCEACARLANLDLKIVIHCGDAIRYRMGSLEDFTGQPLVVVHQLLKNNLGKRRYVLATESAIEAWPQPLGTASTVHEMAEHALASGERRCHVFDAPSRDIETSGTAPITEKVSDFSGKLAASMRAGLRRA